MPSKGFLYPAFAVLLVIMGLVSPAIASPSVVAGRAAGIVSFEEVAVIPAPSSHHLLLFVYPLHEVGSGGAGLEVIAGFYDVQNDKGVYEYYKINPVEGKAQLIAMIDVDGRPVRPLWLGGAGDTVLVGYTSGGNLTLALWNLTVGVAQLASVLRLADRGELIGVDLFRAGGKGPVFMVYIISDGSGREYHYAVLNPDTLQVNETGVFPVKWYIGGENDTLYWIAKNITIVKGSQVRIIVSPAVEMEEVPGIGPRLFTSFYALVPNPESERVSVLYARFIMGELDKATEYVFDGVTWGRIYGESPGNLSSGVHPSSTVLIALHRGATNKYLVTASAWGLLTVSSNNMSFYISTGASAGRLGVFSVINKDVIVDLAGNVYKLGINEYSLVIRASPLLGNQAVIAVQERPDTSVFGSVHLYLATTDKVIVDTSNTITWPPPGTPTPSPTTTTTTLPTTSRTTSTRPTTSMTSTAAMTATTKTGQPAGTTRTGAPTIPLHPGDWVIYEGKVKYKGVEVPFKVEVEIVKATGGRVVIKYRKVEIKGQAGIAGAWPKEGVTWTYHAGTMPPCNAPGLNLFILWADPTVLPSNGVISGEENGLSYKCVYDTHTGILLSYESKYEIMGATETVEFHVAKSSIKLPGHTGPGGLSTLVLAAGIIAAIIVIVAFLLYRKRL